MMNAFPTAASKKSCRAASTSSGLTSGGRCFSVSQTVCRTSGSSYSTAWAAGLFRQESRVHGAGGSGDSSITLIFQLVPLSHGKTTSCDYSRLACSHAMT
jgi:hypothetical protein